MPALESWCPREPRVPEGLTDVLTPAQSRFRPRDLCGSGPQMSAHWCAEAFSPVTGEGARFNSPRSCVYKHKRQATYLRENECVHSEAAV